VQITVLLEPVANNGYRARTPEPLALCAEGATREEALAKLREACRARLTAGAELIALDVGPEPHPWLEFAGMFKDDPNLEQWKQSMTAYRQEVDDDPEAP
jgi:predicted RNase H-like HicB family nuclease